MTSISPARRAFLRGRTDARGMLPRMPWAVAAFDEVCTRCGDCAFACGESIIAIGQGGYPTADFASGGCTFCGACVEACATRALDGSLDPPWRLRVRIGDDCLSARGITCRCCGEACDAAAIRFRLALGGRAVPSLDQTLCTGCGSCIAICPTHTIQIEEETA